MTLYMVWWPCVTGPCQ